MLAQLLFTLMITAFRWRAQLQQPQPDTAFLPSLHRSPWRFQRFGYTAIGNGIAVVDDSIFPISDPIRCCQKVPDAGAKPVGPFKCSITNSDNIILIMTFHRMPFRIEWDEVKRLAAGRASRTDRAARPIRCASSARQWGVYRHL